MTLEFESDRVSAENPTLEHFRLPAKLNAENTKSTEHTENREKRFTARTEFELSRFSPCPSVFLCELCVEFRDREYSEKVSKTPDIESKHFSRKRSSRENRLRFRTLLTD